MSTRARIVLAALGALLAAGFAPLLYRLATRGPQVATVSADPDDDTRMDPETGAVVSVQGANLDIPEEVLDRIWTPKHLEMLARTYWRFLSRSTLYLVRISYRPSERAVVFLTRPFVLLRFQAPEYELSAERGLVRWRIQDGILVQQQREGGDGYLQIEVDRCDEDTLRVEVSVLNFYPMLASRIGGWFYKNTQSRIHVIVCHGFLRSLVRLDLAQSRVGRFSEPSEEGESAEVSSSSEAGGGARPLASPSAS